MSDPETNVAALKREWLGARIVLIVGFALAIAIGTYAALDWRAQIVRANQRAAAAIAQEHAATTTDEANAQTAASFCRVVLANAKSLGVLPQFSQLSSTIPEKTSVQGRYLCHAGTEASAYTLSADLICRDLKKPDCISLYAVAQSSGAVLFQRQN